jgi:hypothetical protein
MPTNRTPDAIPKYVLTVAAVIGAVLLAKLLTTWAAEQFLHPIPILGGWLKSLEIIEFSNIVFFAILGFGIGSASRHLAAKTSLGLKSIGLIVALPLVFFSSYWLRHRIWINQLVAQDDLPRQEIVAMANQALEQESGSRGFWGYYRTTTKMPILPASTAELERMAQDQQWFRSELTRFSGIEPGVFSMVFDGAGWGIRIFHMLLALLTGLIYFSKGLAWADVARLRRLTKGKR